MTPDPEHQRAEHLALKATGAPKRHRDWTMTHDTIGTDWDETAMWLMRQYGTGFLIALIGPRGTGKTQLAVELLRHAVAQDHQAQYVRAMKIFIDLHSTYGAKDRTENESTVLSALFTPKLLVIDEMQEGSQSAWEQQMLTYLIDVRYGERRDTLLLGNFTAQNPIEARVGDSVTSRLNETGGIRVCDWPSFRG